MPPTRTKRPVSKTAATYSEEWVANLEIRRGTGAEVRLAARAHPRRPRERSAPFQLGRRSGTSCRADSQGGRPDNLRTTRTADAISTPKCAEERVHRESLREDKPRTPESLPISSSTRVTLVSPTRAVIASMTLSVIASSCTTRISPGKYGWLFHQLGLAARCQEECWETCLLAACGHGRYMIEQ